ncbi:MAG TPA: hypothetical protein VFZ68_17250 [Acidimicrobiales bacterium]
MEGPRVRFGVLWFLVVGGAVLHPFGAAVVYGVAAALAARQVARCWRAAPWQVDMATGLVVLPVVGAVVGAPATLIALGLVVAAAVVAAGAPSAALFEGRGGRLAAAGVVAIAGVPAAAAAAVVLVAEESPAAAIVLVVLVSAYEASDFIVGSGGSTVVEGPLAGATASVLLGLPLALALVIPFDVNGPAVLALLALACPLGQVMASSLLPRAGAHAPALRRIDSLLLLGPVWAAASGALVL